MRRKPERKAPKRRAGGGAVRVSVILPAHNVERFIGEALRSVLGQPVRGLEVIVVDDGSTDGTAEVASAIADRRLRVLRLPARGGPARARNAGLAAAHGRWVTFFDADDVMVENALASVVSYLDETGEPVAFGCTESIIDQAGNRIAPELTAELEGLRALNRGSYFELDDVLRPFQMFGFTTIVYARSLVDRVGGYDPSWEPVQGLEFVARVAAVQPLAYLDVPYLRYRIHDANTSIAMLPSGRLALRHPELLAKILAKFGFTRTGRRRRAKRTA